MMLFLVSDEFCQLNRSGISLMVQSIAFWLERNINCPQFFVFKIDIQEVSLSSFHLNSAFSMVPQQFETYLSAIIELHRWMNN